MFISQNAINAAQAVADAGVTFDGTEVDFALATRVETAGTDIVGLNAAQIAVLDTHTTQSATLADNTGIAADVDGTHASWAQATYNNVLLAYSLSRGSDRSTGLLAVNLEGGATNVFQVEGHSDSTTPPLGITFTAHDHAGSTKLQFTSTATGSSATFVWYELLRV